MNFGVNTVKLLGQLKVAWTKVVDKD